VKVSVPGNLLLVGEYAVLEEGGLGVAAAVDRRVVVTAVPSTSLVIEGRFGRETVRWTPRDAGTSPLFGAVADACRDYLKRADSARGLETANAGEVLPALHIVANSGAFFIDGRKTGYGSSAAVAVGMAWALLSPLMGPGERLAEAVRVTALEAHRAMQGGRGSGYDVYTSLYGGFGVFTGGAVPSWKPCRLPWLGGLGVFRGRDSVRTPGAVSKYRAWKETHPEDARRFLSESNAAVRALVEAADWPEASGAFAALRKIGLDLGDAIGVSARMTGPGEKAMCKAVGAGNEIGVCTRGPGLNIPEGCEPLSVSDAGTTCTVLS
jgi:phosphomevalonate kinase